MKPTIEVLDKLVEMMFKLDCGNKDVLEFVCECKHHQERLHETAAGVKMKTIEECIRHAVSRFPGREWNMFKIAHNTKPTTNWGDLIASVELFQQVTGSTKIFSQDANLNRQPPNYNKAFAAGVEDEYQQERDPRKCYNCGKPGHFARDYWSSWNWETGVGDVEGKGGKGGKGGKDGKGNKGKKGGKGNWAPRGGKGGKGYQGNKGWKSNKETSYVIDAGGDDEVHTCFVLNDSNPSSHAPTQCHN